jgi:DMSO reductase family type II enzyme chaperone
VFGNYRDKNTPAFPVEAELEGEGEGERAVESLQTAIDIAVARSFLYRLIAKAFEDPTPEGWATLTATECPQSFPAAIAALSGAFPALADAARGFVAALREEAFEEFHAAYLSAFGHAARGSCPLNEIEYGDIKADGLFQPHRLADLAAFYHAFGLELAAEAAERHDHLCIELEFMSVLAGKEAYALEHQLDAGELALGRSAQKKFLHEHLGRWAPAFSRRLAIQAANTPLAAAAALLRAFLESECARLEVAPGSEDLLLRPVEEASESLCASCGRAQPWPGTLVEAAGVDDAEG